MRTLHLPPSGQGFDKLKAADRAGLIEASSHLVSTHTLHPVPCSFWLQLLLAWSSFCCYAVLPDMLVQSVIVFW